jgi:hypothetical protein
MPSVQDIYRESVQPLPAAEQRKLANMIVEGLARQEPPGRARVHLADFIETLPPGPRCFRTWEEFERAMEAERDSWDR